MSYILEALKRSERERGQGAVSPLTADLRIADTERAAPRPLWPWVGAAVLIGVLFGAAGWWLALRGSSPGPAPLAGPVTRTGAVPRRAPAVPAHAPASVPTEAAAKGAPVPPTHPALPAHSASPLTHPVPPARPAPSMHPVSPDHPTPSAQSASRPASAPPSAATAAPVPNLDDLPVAFRAQLPHLQIEVYVYSPRPELRWVLINLHRYREGDRLPGGVLLERITQDGLILDYAGRRFRLPRPG